MCETVFSFFKDLFFPAFIAYITAKLTLQNYKSKAVFKRQKKLYLKFLDVLFLLKKEPFQQFSEKTMSNLETMQAEFSIYASKKCRKDFSKVTEKIRKMHDDFLENRDPNEDEIVDGDLTSAISLQESYDSYKDKHKMEIAELENQIYKATKNIQKSLGIR